MKNVRVYILGAFCLLVGAAIGWLVKPGPSNTAHDHDAPMISSDEGSSEVWTCSMHPQIRANEFGLCPICEMDLIPADNAGSMSDDPTLLQMSPAAAKLAQIETFVVGGTGADKREMSMISVDGQVALDERTVKSQTAHLAGRIEDIQVTFEGQYVRKGQAVATIYSTELLAASQELITASKFDSRVSGLQDAAIQKLKNWEINDKQIEDILQNGKPLETITIYANFGGYVLEKRASLGDYLMQGQPLYTIGSTSSVWLLFDVFESDASGIDLGSQIDFTTPSMPTKKFVAKVSYIDPLLNEKLRTIQVRAEIKNPNGVLKPGMLLKGEIQPRRQSKKSSEAAAFHVPNSAILWTGRKSVVYVQDTTYDVPTYQFREVTVEERGSTYSRISDGLILGDLVVSQGAFAVDAASQLNNTKSMINRDVEIKTVQSQGVPSFAAETVPEFKLQLDALIMSYIEVKDALIQTDASAGAQAALTLLAKLGEVDMTLVEGPAHDFWMQQQQAIEAHADKIAASKAVEEQRSQFDFLSKAMIDAATAFRPDGEDYYIQYCPMAIDNQGADWLSLEEQIRNPYFGDKMLKCGSVKNKL